MPAWAVTIAPLVGSLIAVLLLAQAARWMGLGSDYERIRDERHAIALAEEAICGFDGTDADVDAAGFGAIVRNAAGEMLLVKAHGNRFAARKIDNRFAARLDRHLLELTSDDPFFGSVRLDFGGRAGSIASRLRAVL